MTHVEKLSAIGFGVRLTKEQAREDRLAVMELRARAERAERQAEALAKALELVQWTGWIRSTGETCCVECAGAQPNHSLGCEVDAALRAYREGR